MVTINTYMISIFTIYFVSLVKMLTTYSLLLIGVKIKKIKHKHNYYILISNCKLHHYF